MKDLVLVLVKSKFAIKRAIHMSIAVQWSCRQCWSQNSFSRIIQPDLQLMVTVSIVFKAAIQAVPSSHGMLV